MSSLVVALKKVFSLLWNYRDPIAEAIIFLADLIAKTAKKDNESERDANKSPDSFTA